MWSTWHWTQKTSCDKKVLIHSDSFCVLARFLNCRCNFTQCLATTSIGCLGVLRCLFHATCDNTVEHIDYLEHKKSTGSLHCVGIGGNLASAGVPLAENMINSNGDNEQTVCRFSLGERRKNDADSGRKRSKNNCELMTVSVVLSLSLSGCPFCLPRAALPRRLRHFTRFSRTILQARLAIP